MPESFGSPWDDHHKWRRWAYEQWHGKGSWDGGKSGHEEVPQGFSLYKEPFKTYWNDELSVGILERDNQFIGVACLVAKEVVDKESFVRRFGLSFEKDVQWKAVSSLVDHLSRSPLFKAVLVTVNKVPFKLEPDVSEELRGRLEWARRNYNFHKKIADGLRFGLENLPSPAFRPKQMKEEEDHARKFLQTCRSVETDVREHMKPYFLIKENLFAAALFFYMYAHAYPNFEQAFQEILARKRAAKIEANLTYFVKCTEVKDPIIVFNPEFFPLWTEVKKCYCLALSEDCAGFSCDKDIGSVLRKMFTTALELPKEEEIEEQIHIPSEEVSVESPRRAFLGYVVESVVKKKVKKRRVYFPLDVLTGHAILFGKTRTGKSFLSSILINEVLLNKIRVTAFDPHGTLFSRLGQHELLKVVFTHGKKDITDELEETYQDASTWPETNELKLLVVLDETRLLKAKNLIHCLNELGKRGVRRAEAAKDELIKKGLVEEVDVVLGSHRPVKFLVITDTGLSYLRNVEQDTKLWDYIGRVSFEHRLYQVLIAYSSRNAGHQAFIEKDIGDGRRLDVLIVCGEEKIGIEVELNPKIDLGKILKSLKELDELLILCKDQATLNRVRETVEKIVYPSMRERIKLQLVNEYMANLSNEYFKR